MRQFRGNLQIALLALLTLLGGELLHFSGHGHGTETALSAVRTVLAAEPARSPETPHFTCGEFCPVCAGLFQLSAPDTAVAVAFPRGSPAWYEQLNAGLIASTAPQSLPVLPTQLFEAAANLALFVVLFFVFRRFRRGTTALYLIGYALIRFGMEVLRGDPRAAIGPFSISQTISLALLVAGVLLSWRDFIHRR